MGDITTTFDQPYSERTQALPSYFSPSVIGLAGVPYLLDTSSNGGSSFRREAMDVVQQRNTNSQRDLLLLPQDVWRQQAESWHQGAGQSNLDRDDALQYRYEDSFGIDPWTHWQLNLLPSTKRLYNTAGLGGATWLTIYENYLAVVNGQVIYWYDELSVGSVATVGSTTVHAGHPVIDIANYGQVVTTLHDDGKVYTTAGPGATPVARSGTFTNASFIAWEKDYLLIGDGNVLKDITGTAHTIYTHPLTDYRWNSAAAGNSCIYVLGGVAEHYMIHRVGITTGGANLSPAIVAATLPDGEIGYTIDQYLGFILIGTSKGVRIATPNNTNGDLTLGPIIPTAEPVRCFEGQDRFVWFGLSSMNSQYGDSEIDIFPTGPVCGLGRMDLSTTTTSALTPAYASDLCAITETNKAVRSVVTFANKRVFAVENSGVWFEDTDLMQGGWLKQGTMSFSVEDLKTGLYTQSKWLPLQGEIDMDLSYDSTGFVRVADYFQEGTIRSGNTSLFGTQFSRINVRYVLKRDSDVASQGPTLTRWEVRAIPVKGRASRWTLPIMNYAEIEIDGVKYTRDPLAVYDTLIGLIENSSLFTLQESGRSYQVHAKDFVWQPEKLSLNGRAWEGTFVLVVEEVQ
jgi:hypothetical protein